jgi:hypothetical protein
MSLQKTPLNLQITGHTESVNDGGTSGAPWLGRRIPSKEEFMLWTIFVILLVLWLLGMVSSFTLGGFIHILLLVAVVVLLIELIGGRRVI